MPVSKEVGEDAAFLDRLAGVRVDPVFIMGDHRSGTTLLYQLLARTGAFNIVNAYHVLRYDRLMMHRLKGTEAEAKTELEQEFTSLGLTDRGLDHVQVSADLPEEYGFLLGGARPRLRTRHLGRMRELCRKIQWLGESDRPLLLKSPWDYTRFLFVRRTFPTARFLFIHRDPVRVVNSQLRALRHSFLRRNPYVAALAPWYDELWRHPRRLALLRALYADHRQMGVRITCRHVQKSGLYYVRHVTELPDARRLSLRYEDLCSQPESELHRVLAFAGNGGGSLPTGGGLVQPRSDALLPEVSESRDWIRSRTRVYCNQIGY